MTGRPISRRALLGAGGAFGLGAAAGAVAGTREGTSDGRVARVERAAPFHGAHQAGIVGRQPAHLTFLAFDLRPGPAAAVRDRLRRLLRRWTSAGAALTVGDPVDGQDLAAGLGPAGLTLTVGLGAAALHKAGLGNDVPAALAALPAFAGDALDPARCGGDVGVQVCAEDPVVAAAAARAVTRLAGPAATVRWVQHGFLRSAAAADDPDATPRNLMGQLDGTGNPRPADRGFAAAVWATGPAWLRGGGYLVCRRIRMLLDEWEQLPIDTQQRVIGRRKDTGAPLSGGSERTPLDLTALDATGQLAIPTTAHARLAHPSSNHGAAMLRRGFSYDDGYDRSGRPDTGLFFQAFQADPRTGFVPVQQTLAAADTLRAFLRHESSALFAVLPGVPRGGHLGDTLLG